MHEQFNWHGLQSLQFRTLVSGQQFTGLQEPHSSHELLAQQSLDELQGEQSIKFVIFVNWNKSKNNMALEKFFITTLLNLFASRPI